MRNRGLDINLKWSVSMFYCALNCPDQFGRPHPRSAEWIAEEEGGVFRFSIFMVSPFAGRGGGYRRRTNGRIYLYS